MVYWCYMILDNYLVCCSYYASMCHYSSSSINNNTCNYRCSCTSTSYYPVCGADGLTYFSPCEAGCTEVQNDENDVSYWSTNEEMPRVYVAL